ncbi:PRC-barrel domain-containing protein [Nitrosomonas sp. ANs5]|uniref:PRC-barrel domain-containing protein n=1 Tax=Nitrosomonas sp. ANs5 TaxID=3423941 RepID=UPI003D349382
MIHRKFLSNLTYLIGLSFLLTCVTAQAQQDWEKDTNSGTSSDRPSRADTDQSSRNGGKVEFGSTNVAYDINAKKLMDMNVVGQDGKKLGKVDDLILSKKDKIVHAIVSVGGMLGVGGKLVAVPFQDMNINKAKEEAIIGLSEQELEKAPEFKYEYVRDRQYQTDERPVESGTDGKHSAANIEYDINAKALFDFNVVDRNGKKLGDIDDLILSKKDKATYAIVSVGGFLGMGEKSVAVPFDSLQVNKPDEKIVIDVTKEQLEQAPEFKFRN